jgi:hypothetical protein
MQPTLANKRTRRWRRLFVALAGLTLVAVAAIILLPWLLMPDDLRRMQGEWTVVCTESKSGKDFNTAVDQEFAISGSRLKVDRNRDPLLIRLDAASRSFTFYLPDNNARRFFGFRLPVPNWLLTSRDGLIGEYELSDDTLVLCIRGSIQFGERRVGADWSKCYLKRKQVSAD